MNKELTNEELNYIKLPENNYTINGLSYEIISKKNKIITERYRTFFNYIKNINKDDLINEIIKNSCFTFVKIDITLCDLQICNKFINDIFDNEDRKLLLGYEKFGFNTHALQIKWTGHNTK
jgi:hypothetical protein